MICLNLPTLNKKKIQTYGFTLVEVLVALIVLTLMMVAISYIINSAATTSTQLNNRQSADAQARTVFDRMAFDFSQIVKRNDVDCIFYSNPAGNDSMFFYTEGPSYNNANYINVQKNTVSLVGYRINGTPANGNIVAQPMELDRLGKALTWDNTGPHLIHLSYPNSSNTYGSSASNALAINGTTIFTNPLLGAVIGTTANSYSDGADPDYHVLGTQVLRMEISFLLQDGTQSDIPLQQKPPVPAGFKAFNSTTTWPTYANDSTQSYAVNSRWYDSTNKIGYICVDNTKGAAVWNQIGTQDISAVIVTIAVMDKQGVTIINQNGTYATQLANFAKLFVDTPPVSSGTPVAATANYNAGDIAGYLLYTWNNSVLPASQPSISKTTGLPQNVISQMRFYQRYFYLNTL